MSGAGLRDESKTETTGILKRIRGHWFVIFEQIDENRNKTRTNIRITPERFELTRSGAIQTRMIFESGVRTRCEYDAGYGSIMLDIETYRYDIEADENSIAVRLGYRMSAEGGGPADYRIALTAEMEWLC